MLKLNLPFHKYFLSKQELQQGKLTRKEFIQGAAVGESRPSLSSILPKQRMGAFLELGKEDCGSVFVNWLCQRKSEPFHVFKGSFLLKWMSMKVRLHLYKTETKDIILLDNYVSNS